MVKQTFDFYQAINEVTQMTSQRRKVIDQKLQKNAAYYKKKAKQEKKTEKSPVDEHEKHRLEMMKKLKRMHDTLRGMGSQNAKWGDVSFMNDLHNTVKDGHDKLHHVGEHIH